MGRFLIEESHMLYCLLTMSVLNSANAHEARVYISCCRYNFHLVCYICSFTQSIFFKQNYTKQPLLFHQLRCHHKRVQTKGSRSSDRLQWNASLPLCLLHRFQVTKLHICLQSSISIDDHLELALSTHSPSLHLPLSLANSGPVKVAANIARIEAVDKGVFRVVYKPTSKKCCSLFISALLIFFFSRWPVEDSDHGRWWSNSWITFRRVGEESEKDSRYQGANSRHSIHGSMKKNHIIGFLTLDDCFLLFLSLSLNQ